MTRPRLEVRLRPEPVRTVCVICGAPYLARLTDGACPVCATPAPAGTVGLRRPVLPDGDDRLLAIVAFATLANVLLLGLLAVLVVKI